jgi:dienelactone hydrolase
VRLARLASALPGSNILVRVYVHADHGFADRFIQGAWPNPPYHREYGPESWRAVKRWLLELLRPAA